MCCQTRSKPAVSDGPQPVQGFDILRAAASSCPQAAEKPLGVRGPQRSLQWSRCVGPWGLPGAPLLTGLPPRFICHWQRSALPPRCFHRIWRHKVNCPEGTREGPLGGAANPQKALRSKGFSAWLHGRALGAREPWKPRKSGISHFFDKLRAAASSCPFFMATLPYNKIQIKPLHPSLTIRCTVDCSLCWTSSGIRSTLEVMPSLTSSNKGLPKILVCHNSLGSFL